MHQWRNQTPNYRVTEIAGLIFFVHLFLKYITTGKGE